MLLDVDQTTNQSMFVSIIIMYYYLYDIIYYRQIDKQTSGRFKICQENGVCMNVNQIMISSDEWYSVFTFFRHETLRQELSRTISNVIKLQLNTLVYYYIIRILKLVHLYPSVMALTRRKHLTSSQNGWCCLLCLQIGNVIPWRLW